MITLSQYIDIATLIVIFCNVIFIIYSYKRSQKQSILLHKKEQAFKIFQTFIEKLNHFYEDLDAKKARREYFRIISNRNLYIACLNSWGKPNAELNLDGLYIELEKLEFQDSFHSGLMDISLAINNLQIQALQLYLNKK